MKTRILMFAVAAALVLVAPAYAQWQTVYQNGFNSQASIANWLNFHNTGGAATISWENNALKFTGGTGESAYGPSDYQAPGNKDYRISVDAMTIDHPGLAVMGIWYAHTTGWSDTACDILAVDNQTRMWYTIGGPTQQWFTPQSLKFNTPYNLGTWYHIEMGRFAGKYYMNVDGVPMFTDETADAPHGGWVGLNNYTSTVYYDNFVVQEFVPEPSSMIALLSGVGALLALRRRRT